MRINHIANSIVTRILLVSIAIAVAGGITRHIFLSQYLREDLGHVVATQQLSLAHYVARDVNHKIVERQAMLTQLAATLPQQLLNNPDALRNWLGERYNLQPLFSHGMFVTDAQGLTLADYPQQALRKGVNYSDRDYVRGALAGEKAIGRPVLGRVAKVPVLPMAVPVLDSFGTVRAVLVGITALDAPGFLSLVQKDGISNGEGGGFILVSPQDKLFISATQPAMVLKSTPATGVNPLHDRAMQGYRGTGITRNAQRIEEISAIASVPSTGWFVVARIPTSVALATVSRAQRYTAVSGIIAALVFLLVATCLLVLVFRPLLRAAQHADRMTRGESPLEPLAVVRNDEVGHLTEAFNRLLAKLQASQTELAHMAHHDSLTDLPNRALLADRLRQALALARRSGKRIGLLYLDLDGFKAINDRLGHETGDATLIEIARRLSAFVRECDTLARVGGDEFILVMGEIDSDHARAADTVCVMAEKCLDAMQMPLMFKGERCDMGASIGIAIGDGNTRAQTLQIAADAAMYQAKQTGGNRYCMADSPATASA